MAATRTAVELRPVAPSPNTPNVFVDVLKQSSPWQSVLPLATDAEGNVAALSRGQSAERIVFALGQARVPGNYVLLYDGHGAFAFDGASIVSRSEGRMVVRVSPSPSVLRLRLVAIDAADPVRDIRFVMSGFEATFARQPFNPAFVASLASTDAIRFSQWSRASTLASSQVWPLRPRVSRATQADVQGVAPEYAIALSNQTGADPWFVLPVGATDAYVYGFADLAHRFLDPRLHPIFEYGDRVWDPAAPVNMYARMAARNTKLQGDPATAALAWYAVRSRQVFAIVDRVFGSDASRVTHVLSTDGAARASDASLTWQRMSESIWESDDANARLRVAPLQPATLSIGGDTAPPPERSGRPASALHIMPLLPARVRAPEVPRQAGVSGALGVPLENVDLTREGTADWIAAVAPNSYERKATGANQIRIFVLGSQPARSQSGFAMLGWSDGATRSHGAAPDGISVGANASIHITAPADATARVLRVYAGAHFANASIAAHLDGSTYSDASLSQSSGLREGVYTLVYRARTPGRIDVELSAAATKDVSGVVSFRGATLAKYAVPAALNPLDEKTYHNGSLRLGWNADEQILNTLDVASSGFGLLRTLHVDGNVLAQPLYLSNYVLRNGNAHNVLIVATEHDTVYEFDADTGATLNKVSLGKAQDANDVGCLDVRPEYGISSTPTIDRATGTLYVVAATEPSPFDFHATLHALELDTLEDMLPPVDVVATTTLSNGSMISFDPQNQMNRSGLAHANGSIYLGIGSHCDNNAGNITGWLLRYDLKLNKIGQLATIDDPAGYLLSSVWMTGFAPAIDGDGTLYVVTGNGAFDLNHGGKNYGESVLKVSPDLTQIVGYFTPKSWRQLNGGDVDFGSGGIMLLPRQQGSYPALAVTMGKSSVVYLLDRARLGQLHNGDTGALQSIPNTGGGVWGGPAYYSGPTGQFVYYQAGGAPLLAFSLGIGPGGVPALSLSSTGSSYSGYGGSLPIVSSNGQLPGTGIVWLVNRSTPLRLEAYDATDVSRLLFAGDAGVWKNPQLNGFVTPLVANGKVYVPSTNAISVFGLGHVALASSQAASPATGPIIHQLHGTIVAATGNILTLRLRDGRSARIDIAQARAARHVGVLPVGGAVVVYGLIDATGVFRATSIGHTSPNSKDWTPDM